MNGSSGWFAPKRYGIGSVPVTWQGWAITIGFVVLLLALVVTLRRQPIQLFAAVIPLFTVFVVISARTTRGGWRWRWGEDE